MIGPWLNLLATTAVIAVGDFVNRRLFGWLPDDPPRPGRKQHARPTPLAGALLVPTALAAALACHAYAVAAATAIAAATGFVDDRAKEHDRDLGALPKAAALLIASGIGAGAVFDPSTRPLDWLLVAGFAFVVTNATNFLDNMNGVSAALATVGLLTLPGPGWATATGGAALAFLPWNWPRARLFLGDCGAYLLGMNLALGAATASVEVPIPLALAAVAIPLIDFGQVMVVRLWIGHPPWIGDRRHVTHVAHHLGLPTVAVAPSLACVAFAAVAAVRFALAGQR